MRKRSSKARLSGVTSSKEQSFDSSVQKIRRRTLSKADVRLRKNRRRYEQLFLDADTSLVEVLGANRTSFSRPRRESLPHAAVAPQDRLVKLYADSLKDRKREPREVVFKRIEGTVEQTLKKYYGVSRCLPRFLTEEPKPKHKASPISLH